MKIQLVLVAVMLTFGVNCLYAQTQAEINQEAYAAYQEADRELNEVYKEILKEYETDNAFVHNLRAAQRLWIDFRDAELKMKYPEKEAGYYGSAHLACQSRYLESLTRDRTSTLRKWLIGAEEGDVCSGSTKISK